MMRQYGYLPSVFLLLLLTQQLPAQFTSGSGSPSAARTQGSSQTLDGTDSGMLYQGGAGGGSSSASSSASTVSLPLELISFTATVIDQTVVLDWTITHDPLLTAFTVMHSSGGSPSTALVTVAPVSMRTTDTRVSYTYTDSAPLPGANYYRLKMHLTDGTTERSVLVSARLDAASSTWSVVSYPNPGRTDRVRLGVTGLPFTEPLFLTVMDTWGRSILRKAVLAGELNRGDRLLPSLSPGVYYLSVGRSDGERRVHPITIIP